MFWVNDVGWKAAASVISRINEQIARQLTFSLSLSPDGNDAETLPQKMMNEKQEVRLGRENCAQHLATLSDILRIEYLHDFTVSNHRSHSAAVKQHPPPRCKYASESSMKNRATAARPSDSETRNINQFLAKFRKAASGGLHLGENVLQFEIS